MSDIPASSTPSPYPNDPNTKSTSRLGSLDDENIEPSAASLAPQNKQKSGRPKLVDGWRSQVYGNKALFEEAPTRPSKEKSVPKQETSKSMRSKNGAKEAPLSGQLNKLKVQETTSSTEESSIAEDRSHRRDRLKRNKRQTLGLVSLSMPVLAASRYRQVEEIKFTAELYVRSFFCTIDASSVTQLRSQEPARRSWDQIS